MKPSEVTKLIEEVIKHNIQMYAAGKHHRDYIVPMIWGPPGVGKTTMPRNIAADLEIPCRTTIVAQYDAGEFAGYLMPDEENKVMVRYKPDFLPDGKPDKHGKLHEPISLWLLDELPQAAVALMNLCSQITNEYRLGEHRLSPGCTIICTGNDVKHRAGTNQMPTHLRDRLMHIEVDVDYEEWIKWANINKVDPTITAYIRRNPAFLSEFNPDLRSCPSPRSWAKVGAILSMNLDKHLRVMAVSGFIGENHASQFETYMRVYDEMPDPADVIANPMKAPVFGTGKEDILILLLAQVASLATKKNFGNIVKYINRLPQQEFAMYCIMDAQQRNPDVLETNAFMEWAKTNGADLLM